MYFQLLIKVQDFIEEANQTINIIKGKLKTKPTMTAWMSLVPCNHCGNKKKGARNDLLLKLHYLYFPNFFKDSPISLKIWAESAGFLHWVSRILHNCHETPSKAGPLHNRTQHIRGLKHHAECKSKNSTTHRLTAYIYIRFLSRSNSTWKSEWSTNNSIWKAAAFQSQ